MGWDSKPSYPVSAVHTVTLKATMWQRSSWDVLAKRMGVSRGAFLAWAGDMAVAFHEAMEKVAAEHDREMHPERWPGQEP
jgi:hypothetical protein